ncbi:aminotransferase class I/II-fold pyridoxal phosphate-dependent enzyme [Cyanobium sp. FACHB-13342]|uniref:aminotransferase class I/II-fold pyridoxal phosphate-dependent enzyme n=1 Tax=Cyanobium sp. FACHB-13342 TaxID=2692793 RepID=UPI0016812D19|nr:aminotransferase class I/II-fold pyridoxal phosphate-dependent enzyme [Cyanobium sp. FACHB-13342]MBD2424000.1 aminotransferase class I/II-fold pyridoxal phosphate-dependent enzyme [Cyanobium sp. FACHB-13342]
MTTGPFERHGGNLAATAARLGCRPSQLLDASASLVPFGPPWAVRRALLGAALGGAAGSLRAYPDREYRALRMALAQGHPCEGLGPDWLLPGNGAAELFTWAARDGAAAGLSVLPQPGFADYPRALACWGGAWRPQRLPLQAGGTPQAFPDPPAGAVLWLTNPHNPTGALWSRASLEPLLERFALVIADEAFLPLVPGGERQSLIPLVPHHPNLVVIRSLTKLWSIAGLRLGYALGHPERLERWARWRDPWPVNGLAVAVAEALLADPACSRRWTARVQGWVAREGPWLTAQLAALPGLTPLPSAANYLLVRGEASLQPLRERLERRHRILLRDCRSFDGLGEPWLRIGYQGRAGNRRLLRALGQELAQGLPRFGSEA